ncbi:MAG: 4-hydroxy-tetrahydrodipicolinate synthase [Gammaproteobacteria bacterium]|nr:MAG: 4-hydroxy-tetrahydrodipicolinate synthase [Gammaproteobacteria bacterium]
MFSGSMVALVTPMDEEGRIDYSALQKLIDFHVENGTKAIVAVGTTGESATLDMDEHSEFIKKTVEITNGRLPIIGGTGANSTTEALELTENAKKAGCDAALLVTPYYNKPTQNGLWLHYKKLAESVDIPQILYNVPGRTCCDMLPETVKKLSVLDNIIGIKEASGSVDRIIELRKKCGDNFGIFSGDDNICRKAMLAAANGVISVTANIAPKLMSNMCSNALAGDAKKAELIDEKLSELHRTLFLETNPIPAKWAVAKMGLINKGIRLPMTWLDEEYHQQVTKAMSLAGVI